MQHPGFRFPKEEKLTSRKDIDRLFKEGESFLAYPLRVQFFFHRPEDDVPARALFSVPKKRFRRAVWRNRLKRRMRETYRLNKHDLTNVLAERGSSLRVAFVYVGKEELDYFAIEKGMKKALLRLRHEANPDEGRP